jgi:hypothetical protein
LVASAQACSPEARRQPFLVSNLKFDEVQNKVLMKAEMKTWQDIAVTYTFQVRNNPLPPTSVAKRDGKTMSISRDFSRQIFDLSTGGLDIGVSCSPCGIQGSINVDLDVEVAWLVNSKASITIAPQNIEAYMTLVMHLSGKLASPYNPSDLTVVSIPISGVGAGGLFKLGGFLTVVSCPMLSSRQRNKCLMIQHQDLGFDIDDWTGTAQASMGARMSIPNSAILKINLVGSGDTVVSGWVPSFSRIPPSVSAKVEGSAEAFAQAGVEVSAEILSKGLSVGVDMKMPYIQADFAAMADSSGVCGGLQTLGVDLHADIGAELVASASFNEKPFWTYTIFKKTLGTLIDKCYGFGPKNAITGGGGGSPPPKKTKSRKSKTPKSSKKKPTHPKTSVPVKDAKPITITSKHKPVSKTRPTNSNKAHPSSKNESKMSASSKPSVKSKHSSRSSSVRSSSSISHSISRSSSHDSESLSLRPSTSASFSSYISRSQSHDSSKSRTITAVTITTSIISSTSPSISNSISSSESLPTISSSTISTVSFHSNSSKPHRSSDPSPTIKSNDSPSLTSSSNNASASSVSVTGLSISSITFELSSTTLATSTITSSAVACPITGCAKCKNVDPQDFLSQDDLDGFIRRDLGRRAKKDPIRFDCAAMPGAFSTKVKPDEYYNPSEYRKAVPPIGPAYKPESKDDCTNYEVIPTGDTDVTEKGYATEHIYEAKWVTRYLEAIAEEVGNCDVMKTLFFNDAFKPEHLPTPKDENTWAGALMSSIGTKRNTDLMVYLDQDVNQVKFAVG